MFLFFYEKPSQSKLDKKRHPPYEKSKKQNCKLLAVFCGVFGALLNAMKKFLSATIAFNAHIRVRILIIHIGIKCLAVKHGIVSTRVFSPSLLLLCLRHRLDYCCFLSCSVCFFFYFYIIMMINFSWMKPSLSSSRSEVWRTIKKSLV